MSESINIKVDNKYIQIFLILFFGAALGYTIQTLPKKFLNLLSNPIGIFIVIFMNLFIVNDFIINPVKVKEILLLTLIYTVFLSMLIFIGEKYKEEEETGTSVSKK